MPGTPPTLSSPAVRFCRIYMYLYNVVLVGCWFCFCSSPLRGWVITSGRWYSQLKWSVRTYIVHTTQASQSVGGGGGAGGGGVGTSKRNSSAAPQNVVIAKACRVLKKICEPNQCGLNCCFSMHMYYIYGYLYGYVF